VPIGKLTADAPCHSAAPGKRAISELVFAKGSSRLQYICKVGVSLAGSSSVPPLSNTSPGRIAAISAIDEPQLGQK